MLQSYTALSFGKFKEARELQKQRGCRGIKAIIDRPALDYLSPAHTLARARAAVINGDTAAARKSYQDFFALWRDADSDLPVLVQARKEYAELK